MEALIALILLFLPALIYFIRSPYKPSNADILATIIGVWLALVVLLYLGKFFFSKKESYWLALFGWIGMSIYAWKVSGKERVRRRKKNEK
jgi:membrane associated rhomboid family serine protease